MQHVPILKDIVLLGGGHTHTLVVKKWGMNPLPGIRLTLVSQDVLTPYSGMLPGYIAGHYTREETHIDLARLCRWSGVRFIEATASGVDLENDALSLKGRPQLAYDLLSIDTGSTPDVGSVPGAAKHTIPVKPVHRFEEKWLALLERINSNNVSAGNPLSIGVVGAGVGGLELLLALDHALSQQSTAVQLHWFVRGDQPLRTQPASVAKRVLDACQERGIQVHSQFDVAAVKPDRVVAGDGTQVALDEVLWVTAARAPDWPAASGFQTDAAGFICVNQSLQSLSRPNVFAAGDIASLPAPGVAKAGVFAVRQAPVLFENLRRAICNKPLRVYRPQKHFLTLISLGKQQAIATRNGFALHGVWAWRWKDWIDRQFMNKFSHLPKRSMVVPSVDDVPPELLGNTRNDDKPTGTGIGYEHDLMFCGGCGAKVGAQVLADVINQLQPVASEAVHSDGLADDTCTIDPQGQLVVQSVDQFRASFDDNYLFGRVAALHALSDLYASDATPDSALALATLPFSDASIQKRDLHQMMAGAVEELNAAGCMLAGGHTGVGAEAMLGFTVNGFAKNGNARDALANPSLIVVEGDVLLLTKGLGTGVVMAADMRSRASGEQVRTVMQSMLRSNREAADILSRHQARIATDITGFGLLGHLQNLLQRVAQATGLCAEINLDQVPFLPGALTHAHDGISSSLYAQNAHALNSVNVSNELQQKFKSHCDLLVDPQTNGGLLALLPESQAQACLVDMKQYYPDAAIIGHLTAPAIMDSAVVTLVADSEASSPQTRG